MIVIELWQLLWGTLGIILFGCGVFGIFMFWKEKWSDVIPLSIFFTLTGLFILLCVCQIIIINV